MARRAGWNNGTVIPRLYGPIFAPGSPIHLGEVALKPTLVLPRCPLSLSPLSLPFSAPPFPPAATPSFLCSTKEILKYKQEKVHSPSVLEKGSA